MHRIVKLENKLQHTRVYGYTVDKYPSYWPDSIVLCETHKNGGPHAHCVHIPSDPDDALKLVQAILSLTHGELSAQAIILEATGELPKED